MPRAVLTWPQVRKLPVAAEAWRAFEAAAGRAALRPADSARLFAGSAVLQVRHNENAEPSRGCCGGALVAPALGYGSHCEVPVLQASSDAVALVLATGGRPGSLFAKCPAPCCFARAVLACCTLNACPTPCWLAVH